MSPDDWREIILRVTPKTPDDLDELTAAFDERVTGNGKGFFPEGGFAGSIFKGALREDIATVGITMPKDAHTAHDLAIRICCLGLENDAVFIALSNENYSGLERYGIRTEAVRGNTPAQKQGCEEQLRAFWDLNYIL
jgi:hypothetical protein